MTRTLRRAACLACLLAGPALAQSGRETRLALEAGTGKVLTLATAVTNIFVADPKIAEVRPASATSLFIFGVGAGHTTVAAMDSAGHTVAQYDVVIHPSTFAAREAEGTLGRLVTGGRFRVTPQAKGLLLTGNVPSAGEAAQAVSIVQGYLTSGQTVENQLTIRSAVQVNLRVRIVEMSRSVSRALGVNWQAMGKIGSYAINYGVAAPIVGAAVSTLQTFPTHARGPDVTTLVDALAQDNLARVLAEPNLTVISGEAGSFLVGGEFPIPVAQQNNTTTIEFKKYGVALRFVPTVMSDGKINLHVSPEVSALSSNGAVTLSAANNSISIPALTVRRAETSVELGSGQTFALAGLLQDDVTNNSTGVPFLGDIPVLGALFRSNSFQRQETELVILVTPYVVRPVDDPTAVSTPAADFVPPNDLERIYLLRQRGIAHLHGSESPRAPARIPGQAGFIVQ